MDRKLPESQIVRELRDLVDDATPEARVGALYAPNGPVGPFQVRELLIPWRRFTIHTRWSVEESALDLAKLVGTRRPLRWPDTLFVGSHEGNRFRISQNFWRQPGMAPVMHLVIEPGTHGGARVDVLVRTGWLLLPFAALYTSGTIIFAAVTVVLGLVRGTPASLAAPLVPLCVIALFGGIFSYCARRAEVRLRQVFPPAWTERGPYRPRR